MNTICLIRCEPNEYHRDFYFYFAGTTIQINTNWRPLFYPDNDSRNCIKFSNVLYPAMLLSFHSCDKEKGIITYSVSGLTIPSDDGYNKDIWRVSYLVDSAVTIGYLPQDYNYSVEKVERIQELADGSIRTEKVKLRRKLSLSGENLQESSRKNLEEFLDNEYVYVAGLNEGNFYGTVENFSFERIRGLTGLYSYNLSLGEA